MNDRLKAILSEFVEDLQDEELRTAVIEAAAKTLPLPNMIEERVLTLLWTYAAKRLEAILADA